MHVFDTIFFVESNKQTKIDEKMILGVLLVG